MQLKDYLKNAQKNKYAIGQFNFSTLDQLRAILKASRLTGSPVILGTSEAESKFFGLEEIVALVEISKTKSKIPVFLNLDHGKDLDWLKKAIDYGYSAVHFDGSDLALEKNIKYVKKIVEYAHKRGVLVEAEIDPIEKKVLTCLEDAEKFVKQTKADCLAIAIGNTHGLTQKTTKLDFERLKEIQKRTKVFLVLHGGSGIPDSEIKKAIKLGTVKININTELRVVWKNALEAALRNKEIKPYKILPQVEDFIQKKVAEKINLFNLHYFQ